MALGILGFRVWGCGCCRGWNLCGLDTNSVAGLVETLKEVLKSFYQGHYREFRWLLVLEVLFGFHGGSLRVLDRSVWLEGFRIVSLLGFLGSGVSRFLSSRCFYSVSRVTIGLLH